MEFVGFGVEAFVVDDVTEAVQVNGIEVQFAGREVEFRLLEAFENDL